MILGLYSRLFPNLSAYNDMFWEQIGNTLAMFFQSGIISLILGLFIGVLLTIFKKDGIKQNRIVYTILSVIINLFRSIPFIILIIFLIPFTRAIVGTAIGVRGAIIPLVFGTVPFYSRQVETALDNVSPGKIEAARSMGASDLRIIVKVLLLESRTSLITGATIAIGTILGYSAMAGSVGGGGLGDIAIRYGYYRYESQIMIVTVILLVVLVQVFQSIGMIIASKLDKRRK